MADTDKLSDVLDNLIDNNSEQAQVNFHDYLQGKMQEVIGKPEPDAADDTNNKKE